MGAVDRLTAPYRLEYTYKRGLGPVLGAFFGALKQGQLLAVRRADGRLMCPPCEYDPVTSEALHALVPVQGSGVVKTVYWVAEPQPHHPLQIPFAYALIELDGTSGHLVHAVDVGGVSSRAQPGLRVAPRWAAARQGAITDIEAFVPEAEAQPAVSEVDVEALAMLHVPVGLDYVIRAGQTQSRFLNAVAQRRLEGMRSPVDGRVLIPPRGACTMSGEPCSEAVEVADRGTVTTFSVIEIAFPGQRLEPPYVCASIILDGADVPLIHLVGGDPNAVRMGMRVQAVWADEAMASMEMIRCFEPLDEPDAPFDSYAEHL